MEQTVIDPGHVWVFHGAAEGFNPIPVEILDGVNSEDTFGAAVAVLGDLDGDGLGDLAVGAPGWDGGRGRVYLYAGTPYGYSETAFATLDGVSVGDHFGSVLVGPGDTDGDGYADLAVAAYDHDLGTGAVYVFAGTEGGITTTARLEWAGVARGDHFGASLAAAGDVSGDGLPDIVIGAPDANYGAGRVGIFAGCDGDADADGVCDDVDCDPLEPAWGAPVLACLDDDADGYGDPARCALTCEPSAGEVLDTTDCDDASAAVHPGAVELCNGVDDDCDGRGDLGSRDGPARYVDRDGDGWGEPEPARHACLAPPGTTTLPGDCDDNDATIHPLAAETHGDGVDQDCDGRTDG